MPEWTDQDYQGMVDCIPRETLNDGIAIVMLKIRTRLHGYNRHQGRPQDERLHEVLNCSTDEVLRYSADDDPWVSRVAGWRLANGR